MPREYDLLRTSGGLALEYLDLIEADFAAANGAAYTPPERNGNVSFRRINVARTIQLLYDCPVVVETFQTSAVILTLPASTASEITDDAAEGRLFVVKNAGTGKVTIKDYLGTILFVLPAGLCIQVTGNSNNQWDFIFQASNIFFDNIGTTFRYENIGAVLGECDEEETGVGFSVVARTGVFVTSITVWTDSGMTVKRSETTLTRTGAFVTGISKKFFEGGIQITSFNVTIARVSNFVSTVTIIRARP
jgi:hypothetical protein